MTGNNNTIESDFDISSVRAQFPALQSNPAGDTAIFFDGPGGTQVPSSVIEAVARYYSEQNSNVGGAFRTSRRTDEVVAGARGAIAELLNAAESDEIVFGPNMTTLTFHLARSIADTIRPGDEIVVTNLDHDANVAPWLDLTAAGAAIRVVDVDPSDCTIHLDAFTEALSSRTRLAAITHASNAVGTIPDVRSMILAAHDAGALVFVDAVQFAPHGSIDVQDLDCDFLACSAYKFFGPHVGALYGKSEHLNRFRPHKVRPARDTIPHKWETGTLNHEGLAGVTAAVNYLASLTDSADSNNRRDVRRARLWSSMAAISRYEAGLCDRLIRGLKDIGDISIHGITEPSRGRDRVPTVAFTWPRLTPRETAEHLGRRGICVWSGNYYALRLMERLGLEEDGGAVRIGIAHYNTADEIDNLLSALSEVPQ